MMHSNKKTLREIDVANKRVLVRVDFNASLNGQRHITDDMQRKIKAVLPTIRYLLKQRARIILMSSLGYPDGKPVDFLCLAPLAQQISELLDQPVSMMLDCVGPHVESMSYELRPGQIMLLENLDFHQAEQANERAFARQLAALGDVYVNDAFSVAHQVLASTVGVTHYLPAVAGLLMEKELAYLGTALEQPARPFVALIGGEDLADKMAILDHLADHIDVLLLGGGVANLFLRAEGVEVGDSLVEYELLDAARTLLARLRAREVSVVLPEDVVIANCFSTHSTMQTVPVDLLLQGWRILDIGPRSIERFKRAIAPARTLFWKGALGVAEMPAFAQGTQALLTEMVKCSQSGVSTIIGGGDLSALVVQTHAIENFTHVSSGDKAATLFLQGHTLPGVAALQEKNAFPSVTHGMAHR